MSIDTFDVLAFSEKSNSSKFECEEYREVVKIFYLAFMGEIGEDF